MSNNTSIAKNTLILYIRMCIMMAISLYTSRLVLAALGVEDYGIYNVVGGFVTMFSFLSSSLTASISRFITYEMGKENNSNLSTIFSTSINVQIIISIIFLFVSESVGVWFLNEKMVIPSIRLYAANLIFQFCILSFIIHILVVPYTASIIAHENMSAFAYINIFDSLVKLFIAIIITFSSSFDRLITYGFFLLLATASTQSVYVIYCHKHYSECRYRLGMNNSFLKEIFSFAGWNFIGSTSAILRDQGGNILINIFCGPTINAARGIALQVSGAVSGLVGNFTTALNPQITKTYAASRLDEMRRLIYLGGRFSFYIMLFSSMPIIFNTELILDIWLKTVPPHTTLFVQLVLIFALSETLSMPLITAQLATGKIKKYQLIVGGLNALNLPFAFIALQFGFPPESVAIVAIIFSQICFFARIILLAEIIELDVKDYLKKVYFNVLSVTIISVVLSYFLIPTISNSNLQLFCSIIICVLSTGFIIAFLGMTNKERAMIISKIMRYRTKSITHDKHIK